MKKLLIATLLVGASLVVKSDSIAWPVASGVSSNLLSVGTLIDNITVTSTSTNITTLRFYDSSTTSTSVVRGAYSQVRSYATNFSVVFTNEADLLITNSFRGTWTYPTSVSAVTNSLPVWTTLVVPAGASRSKDYRGQTIRGLTVVPNADAIVEVDYRTNP